MVAICVALAGMWFWCGTRAARADSCDGHWVDAAHPLDELNSLGFAVNAAAGPLISKPGTVLLAVPVPASNGSPAPVSLSSIGSANVPVGLEPKSPGPAGSAYLIQVQPGVLGVPISAIASKTGETEVTGVIRIPGLADLYGTASKGTYEIRASNVADLMLLGAGLGGGLRIFALTRAAVRTEVVGTDVHAAVEPGTGMGVDVPGGAGEVLRVKVSAGPDVAFGDGKLAIAPAAGISAELVF